MKLLLLATYQSLKLYRNIKFILKHYYFCLCRDNKAIPLNKIFLAKNFTASNYNLNQLKYDFHFEKNNNLFKNI